jgi:hypothetical protein
MIEKALGLTVSPDGGQFLLKDLVLLAASL